MQKELAVKNNRLDIFKRKYTEDDSVLNFITHQEIKRSQRGAGTLIYNREDKRYLDKSQYSTVSVDIEKKKQSHIKNMLLDAVVVRGGEVLDMPYKDLLGLTIKACIPTRLEGEVDHKHSVSFIDIVTRANVELAEIIEDSDETPAPTEGDEG